DFAVAAGDEAAVSIGFGRGDGTFQGMVSYDTGFVPAFLTAADLNGDRSPDLALLAGGGLTVLLNASDWGNGGHAGVPRGGADPRPLVPPPAHPAPEVSTGSPRPVVKAAEPEPTVGRSVPPRPRASFRDRLVRHTRPADGQNSLAVTLGGEGII